METAQLDTMKCAILDRMEDSQSMNDYPRPPDLFSEIDRLKSLFRKLQAESEGPSYA